MRQTSRAITAAVSATVHVAQSQAKHAIHWQVKNEQEMHKLTINYASGFQTFLTTDPYSPQA